MTSFDNSEETSDENCSMEYSGRTSQTSWINLPRLSLIELAYKLKQTGLKMSKENSEWNGLEEDLKMVQDGKDKEVGMTENNEFFFGIEQVAKDALTSINQSYIEQDEECSIIANDQLNSSEQSMNSKTRKKFGCGWCNYTTDSKSHLIRHSRALHKDKEVNVILEPDIKSDGESAVHMRKRHQCDMCQYQTDCRSHLKRHQASVHIKNKSYHCILCNQEFARSEKAKEHHFKHHPEKHFDIRNMLKTTQQANEDSEQRRKKAAFTDSDLIDLYLNHSDQPGTDNDEQPSFNSPPDDLTITNFSFLRSSNSALVDEVQSSEGDNNLSPFPCNKSGLIRCLKCNEMCKDLWQLRTHVGEAHPCSREHFCKVCPYSTNQQQRLLTHMLKHKEIFCGLCDFSTTNNFSFRLHVQTCNFKRVYTCSHCNIPFNNFYPYKQHMTNLHNDHTTIQCPDCQFASQTGKELSQHLKLHQWKGCQVCSFHSPNHQGLVNHISEVHSTNEDGHWVCLVCRHSEESTGQLAEHFKIHVPGYFHCFMNDCSFKSLLESSLELHSKYMHSNDSSSSFEVLMDTSDIPKHLSNNSKQSFTRKNEHPFSNSTPKRMTLAAEANNDLHRFTTNTDPSTKKKPPDAHSVPHHSTIPSFLFPNDDVIVVTPTSPNSKKDKPMYCPRCPERAPFVYKRSFQKHLSQHAMEDQLNKR